MLCSYLFIIFICRLYQRYLNVFLLGLIITFRVDILKGWGGGIIF